MITFRFPRPTLTTTDKADTSGVQGSVQCAQYNVHVSSRANQKRCLVDRGANGCIIGSDVSIVSRTNKCIDLTGVEDHTVRELNIVHAACVAKTHLGNVISHVHQGAYMPDSKSILSPLQLESNGCTVVDKARGLNGGEQPYVQSPDGCRIPLSMAHGLMCAKI